MSEIDEELTEEEKELALKQWKDGKRRALSQQQFIYDAKASLDSIELFEHKVIKELETDLALAKQKYKDTMDSLMNYRDALREEELAHDAEQQDKWLRREIGQYHWVTIKALNAIINQEGDGVLTWKSKKVEK